MLFSIFKMVNTKFRQNRIDHDHHNVLPKKVQAITYASKTVKLSAEFAELS